MEVLFSTTNKLSSLAIRAFEGGSASHCAIAISEDSIIDSTFKYGVSQRTRNDWIKGKILVDSIKLSIPNEENAINFAKSQLGKPYDFTALVGFLFWRSWQDTGSWYCSELVTASLLAGGLTLADRHKRIPVRLLREITNCYRI